MKVIISKSKEEEIKRNNVLGIRKINIILKIILLFLTIDSIIIIKIKKRFLNHINFIDLNKNNSSNISNENRTEVENTRTVNEHEFFKYNESIMLNNYSYEAIFRTTKEKEKVFLINNIYTKFLKGFIIDKKKILPTHEYIFSQPGDHHIIALLNIELINYVDLMFYNITNIISITINSLILNTKIQSFYGMFKNCINLEYVNFSNNYSPKIINFSYVFQNCFSLTSLDFSQVVNNETLNISFLFSNCTSLKKINLSNFDTSNIKDMSGLFYNCTSLSSIDLTTFNTQNVYSFKYMFEGCSSLRKIDINFFKISNLKDASFMFKNCHKLISFKLPNFGDKNNITKEGIFYGCESLQKTQYDFCIIGSWFAPNYGCMATYYALHQTLKALGYSILMIDNPNVIFRKQNYDKCHPIKIGRALYNINPPTSYNRLYELNNKCKGFLVGSDQIWRDFISRSFKQFFYLDFVDSNKKKVAYGTSFGDKYRGTEKEKIESQKNLKRFDNISLRDALSVNITKNIFGIKNVVQVSDPTFICNFSEYEKLVDKSKANEKGHYILAYILDPTEDIGHRLEKLSKDKNITIIIILDENQKIWKLNKERLKLQGIGNIIVKEMVDLNDFMWYYSHSQAVFTDSFHGTIFSIIFKKPFISLRNNKRGGERFISLLEPINLRYRLFDKPSCINERYELYEKIDYKIPYLKLNKIKEFSLDWLKNSLK